MVVLDPDDEEESSPELWPPTSALSEKEIPAERERLLEEERARGGFLPSGAAAAAGPALPRLLELPPERPRPLPRPLDELEERP